jgi:hypothetical protein
MATKIEKMNDAKCLKEQKFIKVSEIANGTYELIWTGEARVDKDDATRVFPLIDLKKGTKKYAKMLIGVPDDIIKACKDSVKALCSAYRLVKEGESVTFVAA